jgi:DUF971 family protein
MRVMALVPRKVEAIGEELAIVWEDGAETYLKLADLRRLCPCAGCAGERDLFGRLMTAAPKPLTTESLRLAGFSAVGGYALQLYWGDGHSDGLYSYVRLREWGEKPPDLPKVTAFPLLPTR